MIALRTPTAVALAAFRDRQASLPLTYARVGVSRDASLPGFDTDCNAILLGHGDRVFAAACNALRAWKHFPAPWTRIVPADSPLREGVVVAMLARVFGVWWINACRIVATIDEPGLRFGFAYGTLPGHVECGEEQFLIERRADDSVWYEIRAVSRPRHPLVRLAYPIARRLQRRFVRDSQQAMKNAVGATS